jgi:uncharacterized delta-60 repeat protein
MNKLIFLCANFLLFAFVGQAQPGAIDTTFDSDDNGFGIGDGTNYEVSKSALQNDGKILIGGYFTKYNNVDRKTIARLNTDGTIDTSFNTGFMSNSIGILRALLLQPDGKIIAGGIQYDYNPGVLKNVFRLNANGTVDGTFNTGSGPLNSVNSLAIQTDGKIIIGGLVSQYNGVNINRIARLNSDGSYDASFNQTISLTGEINVIAVQSDGKIICGGSFKDGGNFRYLVRLNADGSKDLSFNLGLGNNCLVTAIKIQDDGKIVFGGTLTTYNGTPVNNLARLNADGTLDTTFSIGLIPNTFNQVNSIDIQNDGKIIIGTNYNGSIPNLFRYDINGIQDTSFHPILGGDNHILTINIQSDGKTILGGNFRSYDNKIRNYITRVNSLGRLDTTFASSKGANGVVYSTDIQNDGKIILAGNFSSFNDILRRRIARLNTNGSLDSTFTTSQVINNIESIYAAKIQLDGKIIIGGQLLNYNNTQTDALARLFTDGSHDGSFNHTDQFGRVYCIRIENDQKILIGGNFTQWNNSTLIKHINRLDPLYGNDANFADFISSSQVNTISLLSDGKIIFGNSNHVVKIDNSGSLDISFADVYTNNQVLASAIQNDGKIIVGGEFLAVSNVLKNRIVRLNSNGTIDPSYNIGLGANDTIYSIVLQKDGKAIIGGAFTSFNGIPTNRITRLNLDGTIDTTFNPSGTGANHSVRTISIQADDHVIIGGDFTSYNGVGRNRIARICVTDAYASNTSSVMCLNSQSTLITHTTLGAIDIGSAIGLPPGVSASWSQDTIKINGTPTATGTYNYSIPLISTCGSVTATGTITVALNTDGTDVVTACDNFTWIDSINYSSNNNSATFHLLNHAGCDSLVTLNLTIIPYTESIQSFEECPGFSVAVGSHNYNSSGIYTDIFIGSNGCDSIVITNLNIFDTDSTQSFVACEGFSVNVGTNTYNTTGTYTDVLISSNGCDSTVVTYLTIDSIDVSVSNSLNILMANQAGATYQWLNCDNNFAPIPGEVNQSFIPLNSGNYATIISQNTCIDTSLCYNILVVGLKASNNLFTIDIYPNPTNGKLYIYSNKNISRITVYDMIGNALFQMNKHAENIDLSLVPNGIYIIEIADICGAIERKKIHKF